ncbi:MAG: hypothetical protein GY861_20465 [bacterium]|nr:hypothetical protein [bacterium]
MKILGSVQHESALPVYDITLKLKGILEEKVVQETPNKLPDMFGHLHTVLSTKVVLVGEMDCLVDDNHYDLMEQGIPYSVRTPNKAVRITIETL